MSQILNNKMLLDESALARNEGEEERAWRERVAFHAARWTRESYEAVCNFMNDLLVTRYHENHEVNHEVRCSEHGGLQTIVGGWTPSWTPR